MSRTQNSLQRAAPRSTSHGKHSDDTQIINDLVKGMVVSEAELSALELLVGWDRLAQLLQTCGVSDPDV